MAPPAKRALVPARPSQPGAGGALIDRPPYSCVRTASSSKTVHSSVTRPWITCQCVTPSTCTGRPWAAGGGRARCACRRASTEGDVVPALAAWNRADVVDTRAGVAEGAEHVHEPADDFSVAEQHAARWGPDGAGRRIDTPRTSEKSRSFHKARQRSAAATHTAAWGLPAGVRLHSGGGAGGRGPAARPPGAAAWRRARCWAIAWGRGRVAARG